MILRELRGELPAAEGGAGELATVDFRQVFDQ
jgi:hypothetical protein